MEPAESFDVLFEALLIQDKDTRLQTFRTLIESGVNVNSCWNKKCKLMVRFNIIEGYTVLMAAVCEGHVDCVQVLLDAGANVIQSDVGGQTALIEAAGNEDDKCVKLLIEAGADVNHSTKFKGTALIMSASVRSVECLKLLLAAGTNVNGVDINGNTALICCLKYFGYSYKDKACLKLLIDAGVDIDTRNNNNLQPVHYALKLWKRATFPVEYLISENCNLSQASYDQVKVCAKDYRRSLKLDQNGRLDMLKLLFACGLPRHLCQTFIVEKDASIKNWWVETVASQPNTLKSICVFKIRRNLGLDIKSKVTKLNLPNVIQNLILLKGILSLECFD